ncbi:MAG: Ig-like domain-containing protein [Chitinispirillaceae bacterium]|nr:Ig-like domain-containing protein [Chitinispirillaceae bacterium]
MVRFPEKTKWTVAVLTASLLLFTTCKLELGESPIGPPVNRGVDVDTTYMFDVSSTRSVLKADGIDSSIITAQLTNSRGNAVVNDTIRFTTNGIGVLTNEYIATDSSGKATVILRSNQVNDTCVVTAQWVGTSRTDSVRVIFSGVKIKLETDNTTLKINAFATITAQLLDGADVPIGGDSIAFSTAAGVFENNRTTYRTQLDPSGKTSVRVTARATGLVTFYATCRDLRDSISITFDSTTGPVVGTRYLHLTASKTQLKADNSDSAIITATLVDSNSNPVVGDTVEFRCVPPGMGNIDKYAIIQSNGKGSVTLRSRAVNGVCLVKAYSTKDSASIAITFSGVKLRLESDVGDLKINEDANLTAVLSDASGNPIGGDTVIFRATNGVFSNGSSTFQTFLDPNGYARAKVTSPSAGTVRVYASALNSSDSLSIVFTNNALLLVASKATLTVGGTDQSQLTATYVDGSNRPVVGATVTFSTNAGTITTATTTTDASGKAYSALRSANFAGTATVVASTSAGNAVVKINFVSAIPAHLAFTLSPDNIGINGGISSLTATVTDANDNMVTGAEVNFRILKGPGGGEYIDKPVVATQNGIAHAQLYAGSVPSQYRGCLVMAAVGSIADTSKLTISGEPYAISVARPQSDTVQVENVGQMDESTFDYNVGAVVVDINGNPVADGTRVNFSAVVSGMAVHRLMFDGWTGVGSADDEKKPKYTWRVWDVPFEDINNNKRMDENDLTLDFNDAIACRGDDVNGDGVCDFNPLQHDLWFDFNDNGIVDTVTRTVISRDTTIISGTDTTTVTVYDTITTYPGCEPFIFVEGIRVWADLNPNGVWDMDELIRDVNGNNRFDVPASGDLRWYEYECLPYWYRQRFDFTQNDFGVSVTTSATCKNGVAYAKLTYPRQFARRLVTMINAEANGVRDRDGERFVLPVIVGK